MPDQAVDSHEALHPLVIGPPAAPMKLSSHPRRAVGAGGAGVDGADLGDEGGLGLFGR
jgi:hypothetical protein